MHPPLQFFLCYIISSPGTCYTYAGPGQWKNMPNECYFPFHHNGKTYTTCTSEGKTHPWCATVVKRDPQSKWFLTYLTTEIIIMCPGFPLRPSRSDEQQRRGWMGRLGLLWQLPKGGEKPSVWEGCSHCSWPAMEGCQRWGNCELYLDKQICVTCCFVVNLICSCQMIQWSPATAIPNCLRGQTGSNLMCLEPQTRSHISKGVIYHFLDAKHLYCSSYPCECVSQSVVRVTESDFHFVDASRPV